MAGMHKSLMLYQVFRQVSRKISRKVFEMGSKHVSIRVSVGPS